ncbi:uncharacterized protein TNCV_1138211 [Trichonephila clavipes]|nr:uncharacterized protein TNCV_1138211 [Trichonephila clavipes]
MDENGVKLWIKNIWQRRPGALRNPQSLLVWDMFRSHLTDNTKKLLTECNTDIGVIPGGLTSLVQPLDLHSKHGNPKGEKKRRTEEHREFNWDWTESFAFISSSDGLPTCLIYHEKLAHNKKSNLERRFIAKHNQFSNKYPAGKKRKKAVDELQKQKQQLSSILNESFDIKDTAQVALFARYMSSQGPKEERLGLLPLSGQTRGEDIANDQYRDKTSTTVDTNYFSTVIKNIKDEIADRDLSNSIPTTLAFIVNPLKPNGNDIRIEPFGIDTGSLKMQLIDLKK